MNKFFLQLLIFSIATVASAQAPNASFSISDNAGCPPHAVTFTSTSTGNYNVVIWNTGVSVVRDTVQGGVLSPINDLYINSGNYNVCLTVTDTITGLTDTECLTSAITVFTPPQSVFSFSPSPASGCVPFQVQFTDNSTQGSAPITSWLWSLPGSPSGSYSTQNPTITYNSTAGSPFGVSLRVTDANGCQSFASQPAQITAYAHPVANFVVSSTSSCSAPFTANFTNTSTWSNQIAPGIQFLWNFGDGTTSTSLSPTHTYTQCGTYTVSLTVNNPTANGCSDTKTLTNLITVENLTASIQPSTSNICEGSTVNFTNNSNSCLSPLTYSWDYGDGIIETGITGSHTYTGVGCYTPVLTASTSNGCVVTATAPCISVITAPTANFSATSTVGCSAPFTASFVNSSTSGANISYQWNFGHPASGAQNTSTLANPTHTYTACGSYTVRLIVIDNTTGCRDTLIRTDYIAVETLNVAFAQTPPNACANSNVNYTNQSTVCASSVDYSWSFSDGGTAIGSNAQHPFAAAGCYTAVLMATTSNGCVATATRPCVNVLPIPVVNFTVTSPIACSVPHTVSVTDNTAGITTRVWQFGPNVPSATVTTFNNPNASYTYTAPGVYSISLTATGANGCSATSNQAGVVRIQGPVASFSASERNGCAPQSIDFTNTSTVLTPGDNIVSTIWDFNDPNSPGTVTTNLPTIAHVFQDTGCYNITMITTTALGCSDTITYNDYLCLGHAPQASYTQSDSVVCINGTVTFTANVVGAYDTLIWCVECPGGMYINTPTVIHQYEQDTLCFPVIMIAAQHFCFDTLEVEDGVCVLPPSADFSYAVNCPSNTFTVDFTDESGSADSWYWDFGLPGIADTSRLHNPSFTYPGPGSYSVLLIVSNTQNGCVDSSRQVINVDNAFAQFQIDDVEGCATFVANAINVLPGMDNYTWSATHGTPGGQGSVNGTFTYPAGGIYNETFQLIAYEATSNCRDTATLNQTVIIHDLLPEFTHDLIGCADYTVNFINQSTAVQGTITGYNWTFGGGFTSTLANPTVTYTLAGGYSVILTVTDAVNGCQEVVTHPVYISDPQANFSIVDNSICLGDSIFVTNTSTGASGYQWSATVGNVNNPNAFEPQFLYPTAGVFPTVYSLTATDGISGCTDVFSVNLNAQISQAIANYSLSDTSICVPGTVAFTDLSSSVLGSITNWQWDLVNNSYTENTSVNHTETYTTPATYPTVLTVTNSNGCVGTHQIDILGDAPAASFTPSLTTVCRGTPVVFVNNSTGSGLTSIFDYGDGTRDTTTNTAPVSHVYTTQGLFTASLYIENNGGCRDTFQVQIDVPIVQAAFTNSNSIASCPPLTVDFFDNSVGNLVAWNYNFGDNQQFGATPDYSATYNYPGFYDVTLEVTDVNGCVDSVRVDSLVQVGGPIGALAYSPLQGCVPFPVGFTVTSPNAVSVDLVTRNGTYTLPFSNGTASITHNYDIAGDFVPFMVLEDASGCQVLYQGTDTVVTESLELNLISTPIFSCDPDTVFFTAFVSSSETPQITWTFNGGVVLSQQTVPVNDTVRAVVYYPVPGANYSASINVSNSLCNKTRTISNITMAGTPVAAFSHVYPDPCHSETVVFTSASTTPLGSITNSVWDFGDLSGGVGSVLSHTYPAELNNIVPYTVQLFITNQYGCSDTINHVVNVYPLVIPQISDDTTICLGTSANLVASGALTYNWSPVGSLTCGNCTNPTANPLVTTNYTVTFSNTNGCDLTRQVRVYVNDVVPVITKDTFLCIGDTLQLTASGGASYQWAPPTGLSSTFIPNPLAYPLVTTTYTLTVTDTIGCADFSDVTVIVYPLPAVAVSTNNNLVCPGSPTQLIATATGSGGYSYQWDVNDPGLTSYYIGNPYALPLVQTTYNVTVTDIHLCFDVDSITINVLPIPAFTLTEPDTICPGASMQLEVLPPNVADTYQWSPTITLSNGTIYNPVATPPENTAYYVTLTFANGCTVTDTTIVWITPLNDLSAGADVTICLGDTAQLQATGTLPLTYHWYPDSIMSDSSIVNPIVIPTFGPDTITCYVDITRQGCMITDSMDIRVITKTELVVEPDAEFCPGDSVQLFASGGDTYIWSPSQGLSADTIPDPIASPTETTTYTVIAGTGACETDTAQVTVSVRPLPIVDLQASRTRFMPGEDIQLNAVTDQNGYTYGWTPNGVLSCTDCPNPSAFPDNDVMVYVSVQNEYGCMAVDSVYLRLNSSCVADDWIIVPNGFTPNGDGKNDVLYVRGVQDIVKFAVYNRWGEEVFSTTNLSDGWDGRQNGRDAEGGVYVYYVISTCPIDGRNVMKKGNVTLIR